MRMNEHPWLLTNPDGGTEGGGTVLRRRGWLPDHPRRPARRSRFGARAEA
jgi:hypothetical protein